MMPSMSKVVWRMLMRQNINNDVTKDPSKLTAIQQITHFLVDNVVFVKTFCPMDCELFGRVEGVITTFDRTTKNQIPEINPIIKPLINL